MSFKAIIPLVSAAALVAAKTPAGFTPESTTDLIVTYGSTAASNGVVVDKAATASEPTIATSTLLTGTSFMVMMIDLDIPSTTNPHTFLHWVQTDLTSSATASTIVTANGTTAQAFTLTNSKNTAAIVNYTQPNPPAQNPLSHRYTEILVDTSAASAEALTAVATAAQTRVGFDVGAVLQSAGLTANVIAGNFFNVTNAGPASDAATSGAGASTAANTTDTGNGNGKKGKKGGNKGTATGAAAQATGGSGVTIISTSGGGNSTTDNGNGNGKKNGNKGSKGDGTAQVSGSNSTNSDNGNGNGKGKGGGKNGNGNAQASNSTGNGNDNGNGNGNGKGNGKGKGGNNNNNNGSTQATASAAAGLPAASGSTLSNNLTGAAGKNGTGTVTVSGSVSVYGLMGSSVSVVLAGLLGAFVYVL